MNCFDNKYSLFTNFKMNTLSFLTECDLIKSILRLGVIKFMNWTVSEFNVAIYLRILFLHFIWKYCSKLVFFALEKLERSATNRFVQKRLTNWSELRGCRFLLDCLFVLANRNKPSLRRYFRNRNYILLTHP